MIAEMGLFSLIIALCFALFLGILPTIGIYQNKEIWIKAARLYVVGQFIFISIAYITLTLCFLKNDFTVSYVLTNSSLALPWFYKLCAVWGGHEGSMLLWVALLTLWMLAISLFSASLDQVMRARVLVVMGWVSVGFILFLLSTSNPFARQSQYLNAQGYDLNPLLQDPGFLFHPPMLYMGYVGFSVAFAFAIAALWSGKVEKEWTKWARPWTLAAWCCLTLGIILGSWWAYRELGWGGWWFWDPVENASFMPWLVGTALIHSLMVSEQRQQFQAWTLLLAIIAFSLSLIGTFLVRSGVLTSVHAFAVDPQRGFYILCFLTVVIGGALVLFAFRAKQNSANKLISLYSKESALLLNNILLVVIMLTVLLGTIYPLLVDGLGLGKISVGAPYFNSVFVPFLLSLLILMGLGIHLPWQKASLLKILGRMRIEIILSSLVPIILLLLFETPFRQLGVEAILGLIFASWVILSTFRLAIFRIKQNGFRQGQGFWGMICAHIGVSIAVLGVVISTYYGVGKDVRMKVGETLTLAGQKIELLNETTIQGPNYEGIKTTFKVSYQNRIKLIYPEKRIYEIGKMPMTESAIDVSPFYDLYIALGEKLGSEYWSVRLYYKPLVRWIWGGGLMILMGGLISLSDRRYYRRRQPTKQSSEQASNKEQWT